MVFICVSLDIYSVFSDLFQKCHHMEVVFALPCFLLLSVFDDSVSLCVGLSLIPSYLTEGTDTNDR